MTEALQTQAHLLANRELLNGARASRYLVSRMRARTPLGAAEFLDMRAKGGRELYDQRLELAMKLANLHRELFPRESHASDAPSFSARREHEFYRLVSKRLFPLDCSMLDADPKFFWPGIPVEGTQQHDWENGCCPFQKLQTVFKLALIMSGSKPGGWRLVGLQQAPAPPLGRLGWTYFLYFCAVENTPLKAFPLAFYMVTYKTGCSWLDAPREAIVAIDWSPENVARLFLARKEAEEINMSVLALDEWLDRDRANLLRAVELWNQAAAMERQG